MRACAKAGTGSGIGWSICYGSKDVDCWPTPTPTATYTSRPTATPLRERSASAKAEAQTMSVATRPVILIGFDQSVYAAFGGGQVPAGTV